MSRDRHPTADALRSARRAAYGREEFVDQQGFMLARDIRSLAVGAEVGTATTVLDLCCGRGGPGRLITRELGCDYLGVDVDPAAVAVARARATDLGCRYDTHRVPPLPTGPFEVVLLLETMLAFPDKESLLGEVRDTLTPGGRFAFTVEEGEPLTTSERAVMPAPDTVWPVPLSRLASSLRGAGLEVTRQEECSASHLHVVDALLRAFSEHESAIAAQVGRAALNEMLAAHGMWVEWLRSGRVRKFVIIARRPPVT